MEALSFYIFYAVNWIITLLPLRVLYLVSDLFFLILYYFPGYRKKDVATNLRNAFPEKTDKERSDIAKKFYRHLADIFIETFKMNHLGKKEHLRRCVYENPEILDQLYENGKDVALILGHYNNWEIQSTMPLFLKHKCITIYRPLSNKYFDRYMLNVRRRYGMILTPTSLVIREIVNYRKNGEKTLSIFIADQTPALGDIHYWTRFMNQDTPVYLGAEKIAMKYNMAVVFVNQQKVKRGHYKVKFELLFSDSDGLKEHEITEAHVKRLEAVIREKPQYWMWSHRRWKHKRETSHA